MSLSAQEKNLEAKIKGAVPSATEGLKVRVYHRGKMKANLSVGKTYDFYDLASLTKIMFSVSNIMRLVDEKKLELDQKVSSILPWFPETSISSFHLLNHSSGMNWWEPIYKKLDPKDTDIEKWEQVKKILAKSPISNKKKAVYSDLGMLLLGNVLERKFDKPLYDIWRDWNNIIELEETNFHRDNKPIFDRSRYAPTEDCPWRKKILRGEVHDDNTWALGGVAPQAGLFGSIDDLSKWGLLLRGAYFKTGKNPWTHETAKMFMTRSIPPSVGDWALGFMMPTKQKSSAGQYFSEGSIGHTGYTGTSFWFDPKTDLVVFILSNRVYPTRNNQEFLKWRPKIHDWVFDTYMKG